MVRRILGQPRSTVDLREVVRQGKLMLAELCKYGGSFDLATQWLVYLDRLDRTMCATVLANIDHPFAIHVAGEDACLLQELDSISEDDITSLDDFQCYVKLSRGGEPPEFARSVRAATALASSQRETSARKTESSFPLPQTCRAGRPECSPGP